MSICYITETKTGVLIRQENETYFQAAQWCRLQGLGSKDILFSATPPRSGYPSAKPKRFEPPRFEAKPRKRSILRRLFTI